MKLSYSTWGMQETPIDIAIAHCANLGFDGLEMAIIPGWPTDAELLTPADRKEIRRLYDDHQIELCGFSGNAPLMDDSAETRADALRRFRNYLDLASELQKPGESLIVTTTSGGRPEDWERNRDELAEILGNLSDDAASRGVRVGIEPHVAFSLHLPDHALWMIETVAHDALTIHFDISHFNVQGIPMEESVAKIAPVSAHTHIKDERGVSPDFEFLVPGEGAMDYPRYLRLMQEAGYDDHIVVEISLMVQSRPDYDAIAAATTTYEVVSAAFEQAGIQRRRSD